MEEDGGYTDTKRREEGRFTYQVSSVYEGIWMYLLFVVQWF